jgi:deuterolysin
MRLTASTFVILAIALGSLALHANRPTLDVTLSQVHNTQIKAVVKNTGTAEVTFVHLNFFKDGAPVKKVSVYRNGKLSASHKKRFPNPGFTTATEVQFNGIKQRFRTEGLTIEALTTLAPGASYEDEFDISSTTDLTEGGIVTLRSEGIVPVATDNKIVGYIHYSSNEIEVEIDAAKAATVPAAFKPLDRRTKVTSCSGSRATALAKALRNAASLASAAASAAATGPSSRFAEYFKTTSSSTRSVVAARFRAVANEARSQSSGSTTYYCTDPYGYCNSNVLAYTLPSSNVVANCDIYYSYLPALSKSCHAQDQATTTLHEFTHAPGVYSPGTDDLGYGYGAAMALSAKEALKNADTYALFANGMLLYFQFSLYLTKNR